MILEVGGTDFIPGAANELTVSGLDATASSATFRWSTLSIAGTLSGDDWVFEFDANESGQFNPVPNLFDCNIEYDDGTAVSIVLRTGERLIGTSPSSPSGATHVSSVAAGDGLSASPSPIVATGTISLDASTTDLDDVSSSSPGDDQVLVYSSSASEWGPAVFDYFPQEGTETKTRTKAYSEVTDNYKYVYVKGFYRAHGGTESTGDVTLGTGVEGVLSYHGWLTDDSGNKFSASSSTSRDAWAVEVNSSGTMTLARGTNLDDADSGYMVWVFYLRTVDSGGAL